MTKIRIKFHGWIVGSGWYYNNNNNNNRPFADLSAFSQNLPLPLKGMSMFERSNTF